MEGGWRKGWLCTLWVFNKISELQFCDSLAELQEENSKAYYLFPILKKGFHALFPLFRMFLEISNRRFDLSEPTINRYIDLIKLVIDMYLHIIESHSCSSGQSLLQKWLDARGPQMQVNIFYRTICTVADVAIITQSFSHEWLSLSYHSSDQTGPVSLRLPACSFRGLASAS